MHKSARVLQSMLHSISYRQLHSNLLKLFLMNDNLEFGIKLNHEIYRHKKPQTVNAMIVKSGIVG